MNDKCFKFLGKFEGDRNQFKQWKFEFGICLGRANAKVKETYDRIEEAETIGGKESPGEESWRAHLGEVAEYSKDLFGILISKLEGEPKKMAEGMVDKKTQ